MAVAVGRKGRVEALGTRAAPFCRDHFWAACWLAGWAYYFSRVVPNPSPHPPALIEAHWVAQRRLSGAFALDSMTAANLIERRWTFGEFHSLGSSGLLWGLALLSVSLQKD
jgi:hypothetical protein